MNPTVSVVVSAYNYGRFLAAALQSVLAQSFQDFEVIVIDDGSDDNTPEVAASFLHDPRFRYHRTQRQGVSKAKNTGIGLATAPLIAFLDADDRWLSLKLERQLALLAKNPQLGVVYSRRFLMDQNGNDIPYIQPGLYRGDILEHMFLQNFVFFSSALVRREVFTTAGLFDESLPLAEDYEWWLRVASRYQFDFVDEPLAYYRVRNSDLNYFKRSEDRVKFVMYIMRRFLDEQGGRGRLERSVIRRAWVETYCSMAMSSRARSRLAAFPYYLRALAIAPSRAATWRGLLSLPCPEWFRRVLRRLLGRPTTWSYS